MDNRLICPECNKPYKHLITHLQNKHAWEVEDIFNYDPKSKDAVDGEKDTARKVTEAELEAESTVRRSVDKIVMMHALNDLNVAIRDVYGQMEASMKDTIMIAFNFCNHHSCLGVVNHNCFTWVDSSFTSVEHNLQGS